MILLDTHALIWFASEKGLGKQTERIVEKALADDRLAVSAISFWEMAMLIAKGRLLAVKSASEERANGRRRGAAKSLSPGTSQFSRANSKVFMATRPIAS